MHVGGARVIFTLEAFTHDADFSVAISNSVMPRRGTIATPLRAWIAENYTHSINMIGHVVDYRHKM